MVYFLYYLLFANFISAIFFYWDKRKAEKKRQRVPEKTLHILESAGGVFFVLILMYTIRHKNKKIKYFWITYAILLIWIVSLYFIVTCK